ncbi:energy transducer TonB [Sphingomonas sp. BT-65]|uniref:energy transducer TonB n=1 Tax=Sphingomonas sp. BT-65 TaxID=2989821 RepID=UPI0022355EB8|nr:energy transducer TonB [Sphingomonas sp. BT-65]MCW4463311.1 energy transducer TonB [Sphingomonas sp. BT-65]
MAYADRDVGGSRIVASVIVAIILAALGYVFVTGLAYQYIKKKAEEMSTFDIEEPPPPPEEVPPPPPPPDSPVPPPPTTVVVQKPIVQVPAPAPNINLSNVIPPSQPPTPPAPPAPPAPPPPPPPPAISKAAAARGNPGSWVTNDDYPPSALRAGEQGSVGISFAVNAQGRIEGCSVTSSSGSSALDQATCRLVERRGRYSPALDAAGNPVHGGRKSLRFRWQIQE